MVKQFIFAIFLFAAGAVNAQTLRDLNFRYIYNPDNDFSLAWDLVKEADQYTVFFDLQVNDTTRVSDLKIQWETRKSTSDKTGYALTGEVVTLEARAGRSAGFIHFTPVLNHTLVTLKITYTSKGKTYVTFFYKRLADAKTHYATVNGLMVINNFITQHRPLRFNGFSGHAPLQVAYYKNTFPAAAPSFSTAQARVSKKITPDSVFFVAPDGTVTLAQKGLYLAQQDTASAAGVAFRVEDDYPKLGKLESLAEPLIYICTRQEYEKVMASGNDKKKFDQIILSITGNTERARIFMRNYFKRVEAANQYFSSYKEGWKTDRGMVYIIYGIPDEVYLFEDREVWEYKNDYTRERFQFIKSATIFDPENYVLVREKSFTDGWYNMIDLWRKARF
ncbi:MAG TPA: GWxTD domain-containing protein [Cyclobacteriaceae bacterium]|nr:GWxTD domain-containing protein [Cyclobacteriaceae bacterium]